MCPIPESRIYAYWRRKGLDAPTADAATYVIRQMDNAHIRWVREQHEIAESMKPRR